MREKKDRFVCNLCKKDISREEGINVLVANIKRIREDDKFGSRGK